MNEVDPVSQDNALLLAFLAGREMPCPSCGYNLRDLRTPRCPECAEPLSLRVQPTEPRIAWPIAGLIGLSAGAGFSVMMVAFFFISVARRPYLSRQDYQIFGYGCLGPAVLYAIAIFFWLKHWRRIRQSVAERRRILVVVAWSLPAIHIVAFAWLVK